MPTLRRSGCSRRSATPRSSGSGARTSGHRIVLPRAVRGRPPAHRPTRAEPQGPRATGSAPSAALDPGGQPRPALRSGPRSPASACSASRIDCSRARTWRLGARVSDSRARAAWGSRATPRKPPGRFDTTGPALQGLEGCDLGLHFGLDPGEFFRGRGGHFFLRRRLDWVYCGEFRECLLHRPDRLCEGRHVG